MTLQQPGRVHDSWDNHSEKEEPRVAATLKTCETGGESGAPVWGTKAQMWPRPVHAEARRELHKRGEALLADRARERAEAGGQGELRVPRAPDEPSADERARHARCPTTILECSRIFSSFRTQLKARTNHTAWQLHLQTQTFCPRPCNVFCFSPQRAEVRTLCPRDCGDSSTSCSHSVSLYMSRATAITARHPISRCSSSALLSAVVYRR